MSDGRYERVNTEENEPVISGVRGSYAVARVEEVPYEARAVRQENVPEKQPDRVVILGVDVEHVKTQVQRLFSWISARARPLAEFLKFENLNVPNPVVAVERIRINLQKFYYNYVGLFVGGAAVCVLYHPFSPAIFAFVAYWVYGKKKRPGKSPEEDCAFFTTKSNKQTIILLYPPSGQRVHSSSRYCWTHDWTCWSCSLSGCSMQCS